MQQSAPFLRYLNRKGAMLMRRKDKQLRQERAAWYRIAELRLDPERIFRKFW